MLGHRLLAFYIARSAEQFVGKFFNTRSLTIPVVDEHPGQKILQAEYLGTGCLDLVLFL